MKFSLMQNSRRLSMGIALGWSVGWAVQPALAQTAPSPQPSPDLLTQVQQVFPEEVAALQAQCPEPNTLSVKLAGEASRADFICWSAPAPDGSRTGQHLGTLPLSSTDSTFAAPLSCGAGDRTCEAFLPVLQSRYPDQLQQAEFQCAIKRGRLFLTESVGNFNVRCGFPASVLLDRNGDDQVDNEDPASVDTLIATFPKP